ncbi:MAG: oxidoreductase [Ramlibacter sp.]|nr:oxidoreductase [Ramlibacter sp.]
MTQVLSGRKAFVTGGSRGIGAAIVRRLVADGARVVFTYSSSPDRAQALAAELDDRALALRADSGDPKQLRAAVDEAAASLGGLDILVNNAGILKSGDVASFPQEDFDRMIDVNVRAVFVGVQAALAHMGEGGRIVNIGSVTADLVRFPASSVYALTKGAIASFTRGLARDLGPRGITANNVQPGPTETEIISAEAYAAIRPLLAVGRLGQDKEIAALVAWLCREEAAFVNGASITADGGYSA